MLRPASLAMVLSVSDCPSSVTKLLKRLPVFLRPLARTFNFDFWEHIEYSGSAFEINGGGGSLKLLAKITGQGISDLSFSSPKDSHFSFNKIPHPFDVEWTFLNECFASLFFFSINHFTFEEAST